MDKIKILKPLVIRTDTGKYVTVFRSKDETGKVEASIRPASPTDIENYNNKMTWKEGGSYISIADRVE